MKKRILSLFLSLCLLLPIFPIPARAAENSEIRAAVTRAYNELAATLNPGESAYDGTLQLLSYALFGNGEDLQLDSDDYFTGLVMNTKAMRTGFIEGVTGAFRYLLGSYEDVVYVNATQRWYTDLKDYSYYTSDEEFESGGVRLASDRYTGPINSFDEAMILVVGTMTINITIEKVEVTEGFFTYRVHYKVRDNFDFNVTDSDTNDSALSNLLNWVGRMLELGMVFHTFNWSFDGEFFITIANECPHHSGNYYYTFDGTDIVCTPGGEYLENNTTRLQERDTATGNYFAPYYQVDKTMRLMHDRPWAVEFRVNGGQFSLTPGDTYYGQSPILRKLGTLISTGESFEYMAVNQETGTEYKRYGIYQSGIQFSVPGYSSSQLYTFRIENRIAQNGSNMLYLLIDGAEVGPMNEHFISKNGRNESQNITIDWLNGKDFEVNYIYNKSFRLEDVEFEYVKIWENGEGNDPYSYYETTTVAPTCTGKGYTAHVCSQCGDTWKDNFVDPLGHRFGDWEAKNEALHSRACSVCGEEAVDAHSFADGSCAVCGYENHASVEGTWTTDLIMPAADLGVSAPDSVLRATLTFGEDGTASCSWEAVDLTAFRMFFHDMFVNSYYALGYGLGITNFEEIEILCRESTGLGVSEYMDTIVTDEAITAAFTPASTSGTYSYNADHSAILTDLPIMEVPSDPTVENSFVIGGNTLYLNAASWDKPDYTFVCTAK